MKHVYTTSGTCSKMIEVEIRDDGTIGDVSFAGGCNGNLQGIAALVRGMRPEEAVSKLEGIKCGDKPTSCPDQLAQALKECMA